MNSAMLALYPGIPGILIPLAPFVMVLGIAVALAISIAYVKVRTRETERDMLMRRLAHDERMKELEVERLRLQQGSAPPPADH